MDEIRENFGLLKIIKRVEPPSHLKDKSSIYLLCICECGNEKTIRKSSLLSGATVSCGCHRKKSQSKRAKQNTIHGMTNSRLHSIWMNMKRRCYDKKHNQYRNYGLRGIEVDERWHSFRDFKEDMFDSYINFEKENGKDSATIDRIDSDDNYYKENCKWSTLSQQSRNRKDNISITVNGVKYNTLSELAEKFNINYQTVVQRYRAGKRDSELVKPIEERYRSNKDSNIKKGRNGISVEVNGKQYDSLTALQRDYPHLSLVSLSKRYKKGLRGKQLVSERYKSHEKDGK